ncbi:hypothetical protein [Pedobacter mendelii]|uniref:Uncharacterized protein n=1 Tax=Pedobacter mendelii TaxID=1908240 RepID=A0ABQ2BR33_9SPHI|nr:hypothetical protein [Pedobacter mendelii]GGI29480.1 hypothetical protein GCM10008119_37840 [Pedobacter mendelii]
MNKFENPLYSIYPRLYCSGTILVNDVPMVDWYGDDTKDGGYGGDTVINTAILQSGKYKVVGKMLPRKGKSVIDQDDTLSIDFYCADANNWKQSRFITHPKIESPWDGLSENIKYPSFEIQTEIEVKVPFILDGWQNSLNLKDIPADMLFKEVLNYYQQLRLVLKEHNAARFLEMSKEKMKLQEQALYFSESRKKSFLDGMAQLFSQHLEVEELKAEDLKIEILGYGKLVRLIRKNGMQALQFKSPAIEKQSNIELEIKLHKRSSEKGFSII